MSFQVFLQVFDKGEPAGISLQEIRAAFSGLLVELEEDYWQVHFKPEESSDLFLQFLSGSDDLVHVISIDRLVSDMRLWNGVFELLGDAGALFHFPGIKAPLARHAVSSPLGAVKIIGSADELAGTVGEI